MKKLLFLILLLSTFCFGAVFEPVYFVRVNDGFALIRQDGTFDFGVYSFGGVFYNSDGNVKTASGKKITYNNDGSVKRVGKTKVSYDKSGRIKQLGGKSLFYDNDGRLTRIGSSKITYGNNGKVNRVSDGFALVRDSFKPVLCFEIKGKLVVYINKDNEVAYGIVSGGNVFYNKDGRIKSVGGTKVFYNKDGTVKSIGGTTIFYDKDGMIKNVGGKRFSVDKLGRLQYISEAKITYNKDGKISRTGTGVMPVFQNKKEIKNEIKMEDIPPLPLFKKTETKTEKEQK